MEIWRQLFFFWPLSDDCGVQYCEPCLSAYALHFRFTIGWGHTSTHRRPAPHILTASASGLQNDLFKRRISGLEKTRRKCTRALFLRKSLRADESQPACILHKPDPQLSLDHGELESLRSRSIAAFKTAQLFKPEWWGLPVYTRVKCWLSTLTSIGRFSSLAPAGV